ATTVRGRVGTLVTYERRHRSLGSAERHRLRRMRCDRWLVGPPAPLRRMWAHRLLRRLAGAARVGALARNRTPDHPVLRTGRGLVLELRDERVLRRTPTRRARQPSRRP